MISSFWNRRLVCGIKLPQIFVRLNVSIHHIVKAVWKECILLTLVRELIKVGLMQVIMWRHNEVIKCKSCCCWWWWWRRGRGMLHVFLYVYRNRILNYDSIWVCFFCQTLGVKLCDHKWEINECCWTAKMLPLFLFLDYYFILPVVLSLLHM